MIKDYTVNDYRIISAAYFQVWFNKAPDIAYKTNLLNSSRVVEYLRGHPTSREQLASPCSIRRMT